MKKIYSFNFLSRVVFLLITPVFFQFFAFGFIWHSIYWGVITAVLLIWLGFILLSPLFGRIGCGWFCFMGSTIDLAGKHAIFKSSRKKPKLFVRLLILIPFFASSISLYFYNVQQGTAHNFEIDPGFLKLDFSPHYQIVWIADISSALLLGLFLDKRWACKNLCMMGTLCAAGASYSRLLPVIEPDKCTQCQKCETVCLVGIPIIEYVETQKGLVIHSECILCGKCVDVCKADAIRLKFVWNRKSYKHSIESRVAGKV